MCVHVSVCLCVCVCVRERERERERERLSSKRGGEFGIILVAGLGKLNMSDVLFLQQMSKEKMKKTC